MGQVFSKAFAGAVAGLLAWLIWEPQFPASVFDDLWRRTELLFTASLGALVGFAVNAISGLAQGSRAHFLRASGVGLALGLLGGALGYQVGGALATGIFGPGVFSNPGISPVQIIARIVAFVPMGMIIGAALGAAGLSWRRVWVGALGGGLGAAAAGSLFDVIGLSVGNLVMLARGGTEVGIVSRAVMAVAMGLGIGLFTGLIDRLTQRAWVRLVLGRNEYKEWPVDASVTVLGRSETAHVPLFGDPNVNPHHAVLLQRGGQFWLADQGSTIGTGLNGQRVGEAPLSSGDVIQIASFQLQFITRSGRAVRIPAPQPFQPQPLPQQPGAQPVGPVPMQTVAHPPSVGTSSHAPSSVPSVRQVLVAVAGPLAGQSFEVSGLMEVGRETPAIPMGFDSMASRRHARFEPSLGGVMVTDLGSTNGTLVNGLRVQNQTLQPGDTVQIGRTTFRLDLV